MNLFFVKIPLVALIILFIPERLKIRRWKVKTFLALEDTFNRKNISINDEIQVFKGLCYFLGHLRIKLKWQLFPITHIRVLNTQSSQIPFSKLLLRNAFRNKNTQCNIFHEYLLGIKLRSFTISCSFFLNYFF